ncbi:MAG TPA: flagellar basal body P-ring formation chaperone FlgA [Bryobacteraceae bacterium]
MTPLALLFVSLLPAAAGPAACQPLAGDRIYGRDLAAAVPALADLPPDLLIGYAPVPGLTRVFRPAELRRLALGHHLNAAGIAVNVCFAWPLSPITRAAIRAAIEKTLAGRNPQIEIVEQSLAPAPAGELVFPLEGLSAVSDKPAIWKGYISYAGTRRFAVWVNARITIRETHLVSSVPLRVGEPAVYGQLHLETYNGPLLREKVFTALSQITNLVARRDIPASATLRADMFEIPKEVERGDLVTVLIENGAARIETQGIAGQAGRRGEIIAVRNPKTGRPYRARIEDKGTVLVVPGGASGIVGEEDTKS